MKKNNSAKYLSILSIVVAVIGLTLGFAAFSTSLKWSELIGDNKSDLVVEFTAEEEGEDTTKIIKPVTTGGAIAENAWFLSDNSMTVTNLRIIFSRPGQKAVYTFYAHNKGKYTASLKTITFTNAFGENSSKVCKGVDPNVTDALVKAVCDDITLTIEVGDELKTTGSVDGISGFDLGVGEKEAITITVEYAEDGDRADGELEVEFGDVMITYLSVNDKSISYNK